MHRWKMTDAPRFDIAPDVLEQINACDDILTLRLATCLSDRVQVKRCTAETLLEGVTYRVVIGKNEVGVFAPTDYRMERMLFRMTRLQLSYAFRVRL